MQSSFYPGCKTDSLLEVVELALTNSLLPCFRPLPNILQRSIDQKVAWYKHSEADDEFFEGGFVDLLIPKRWNSIYSVLTWIQGQQHEFRLDNKFFLWKWVSDDTIHRKLADIIERISQGVGERIFSFVFRENNIGLFLFFENWCCNVATLNVSSDILAVLSDQKSSPGLVFHKTILEDCCQHWFSHLSIKNAEGIWSNFPYLNIFHQHCFLLSVLQKRMKIYVSQRWLSLAVKKLSPFCLVDLTLPRILPVKVVKGAECKAAESDNSSLFVIHSNNYIYIITKVEDKAEAGRNHNFTDKKRNEIGLIICLSRLSRAKGKSLQDISFNNSKKISALSLVNSWP